MLKPLEKIKCSYEGCYEPAEFIACGRTKHRMPAYFCNEHAEDVTDEDNPEYHDTCPNCGCRFGVN